MVLFVSCMVLSTSAKLLTPMTPSAVSGAVAAVRLFPAPVIPSPTLLIFSPTAVTFAPASCMPAWKADGRFFASFSSSFRASSSAMIWRSSAFACSELLSKPSVFFICSRASFSFWIFSFVESIAFARYSCFCLSSSVLDGSSFRSLLTSCRLLPLAFSVLSTPFRALSSFVTSPLISIVIPFIRLAISASYKFPELRLCRFFRVFYRVIP